MDGTPAAWHAASSLSPADPLRFLASLQLGGLADHCVLSDETHGIPGQEVWHAQRRVEDKRDGQPGRRGNRVSESATEVESSPLLASRVTTTC